MVYERWRTASRVRATRLAGNALHKTKQYIRPPVRPITVASLSRSTTIIRTNDLNIIIHCIDYTRLLSAVCTHNSDHAQTAKFVANRRYPKGLGVQALAGGLTLGIAPNCEASTTRRNSIFSLTQICGAMALGRILFVFPSYLPSYSPV
jgi:hypothetical protein